MKVLPPSARVADMNVKAFVVLLVGIGLQLAMLRGWMLLMFSESSPPMWLRWGIPWLALIPFWAALYYLVRRIGSSGCCVATWGSAPNPGV
jgi:hypothetical protein